MFLADYFVNFRESYAPENWETKFEAFLQKEEMLNYVNMGG